MSTKTATTFLTRSARTTHEKTSADLRSRTHTSLPVPPDDTEPTPDSKPTPDSTQTPAAATYTRPARLRDPAWVRGLCIVITFAFLTLFLFLPLAIVFVEAFRQGWGVYLQSFQDPMALAALKLTLFTAAISVGINLVFSLTAAWALGKFEFWGKRVLISLLDLPFAVSPVISGLIFVLLFGRQGWLGAWLADHNVQILFAWPGVVLATLFVTSPYIVRVLIPLMEEQGSEEEQAALVLGASGWQTFWRVTLPKIRWGVLYGVILCNARAMGEFGAVSVVSGHLRGQTNTLPLHIEILYNEYNFAASFAVSSLLVYLALLTLVGKHYVERRLETIEN